MHQASSEAARRQIVEFEELVSRFERINDDRNSKSTISLDSGLNCYNSSGESLAPSQNHASTLSLDRPQQQQQQISDLAILESLARLSRSSASAAVGFLDQNSSDVVGGDSGRTQQLSQPKRAEQSREQV